jgi:sugar-specific transcriptional regulator TrmB
MIEQLQRIGLSQNEAKAYLALLKRQMLTGPEIAKQTGIPPTKVYVVLDKLIAKGMVECAELETKYYSALSAESAFENLIKNQEQNLSDLSKVAQEVTALYRNNRQKQVETWTLDFAQRPAKFREVASKVKSEALLLSERMAGYYLWSDIIRRKEVKMKILTVDETKAMLKGKVGKRENMTVKAMGKKEFENLPRFYVFDDKFSILHTATSYIYSEDPKIAFMLKQLFLCLWNESNKK